MNDSASERLYDPAATLARGLLAFIVSAWIPMLVAWIMLLYSPASPEPIYEQIRRAMLLVLGLATALLLICGIWVARRGETGNARLAYSIVRRFSSLRLALLLVLLLIESCVLSFLLFRDIAFGVTLPFKFLLVCWTVVLAALMLTIHWRAVRKGISRGRDMMALLGFALSALLLLTLLTALSSRLLNSSGIVERLRGALDYRPLSFIDDGSAPRSREFWAEQSTMQARWLPYSYWTIAPIAGSYINVDQSGRRHTPVYTNDPAAPSIHFFGGSAMWGLGARDAYTIPAQAGRLLAEQDLPAQVHSYAQTGYVSWQDLLLFQAQLALDNAPDLAVFYQGFNDVYAAYLQGGAGLTLRENLRVSDVELGRLVRSGQPALRPFDVDISDYDWSLVTSGAATPGAIAERWLANRRLIRAAAGAHGVRVLFVWQPALFAKTARTDNEQRILDGVERQEPGFVGLYRAVVDIAREGIASDAVKDTVFLTDAFGDVSEGVFFDRVHITERGNRLVAESLIDTIVDALTLD